MNNVAGIIFSNLHDRSIPELTAKRTMGAIPFGGGYRMVDFPLSAMANAGIRNISVIAHHNYESLVEHIGNGADYYAKECVAFPYVEGGNDNTADTGGQKATY